ncbi:MAG: DUF5712 family protein [Flavobacteriaceae bacterium]|nr:DUF5712 family protein [Flavobacteriaceae bacterium]
MYIAITKQHSDATYTSSVADFVNYLEKEDEGKHPELQEHFFDQYNNKVAPEKVIAEIDGNTAKLKKREPKFYSLVVSPSPKELKHINNDPYLLRAYTRELMKEYTKSFYRDRTITVDDIKYYAKIEHERTYRGFEKKIKQNAPYRNKIAKLRHDIMKVRNGEIKGNIKRIERKINKLIEEAPHKVNGELLKVGMKKEGLQTHIHIIVSRKDTTNTYSLSPGAKFKESETILNGKKVKQGFNRDEFFENAEKTFDKVFNYNRNFVESYKNKKIFVKDPKRFFALLIGLPTNERATAFKLLGKTGIHIPTIPTNKIQLAYKAFKKLKKGLKVAIRSSSIGI